MVSSGDLGLIVPAPGGRPRTIRWSVEVRVSEWSIVRNWSQRRIS